MIAFGIGADTVHMIGGNFRLPIIGGLLAALPPRRAKASGSASARYWHDSSLARALRRTRLAGAPRVEWPMDTRAVARDLQKANLGMAAEAGIWDMRDHGQKSFLNPGRSLVSSLSRGNRQASKWVKSEAEKLGAEWIAIEQRANAATGCAFSDTVFGALPDDPASGSRAGDLLLAFRATEVTGKAARDTPASKAVETRKHDWASRWMADRETWYGEQKANGTLPPSDHLPASHVSADNSAALGGDLLRDQVLAGRQPDLALAGIRAFPDAADPACKAMAFASAATGGGLPAASAAASWPALA